jgi:hypothetical protein
VDGVAVIAAGTTVKVRGFSGVACVVVGPQTEPGNTESECAECNGCGLDPTSDEIMCEYCDGTGLVYDEEPGTVETGKLLVRMVGDDTKHAVDPEDCTPLTDEESENVCSCGQLGCHALGASEVES